MDAAVQSSGVVESVGPQTESPPVEASILIGVTELAISFVM